MRRLMRPKRPASQWPHIVFLTLSLQLLHALQRAAGSLLRMRKPHADTGGHRTLRIATRATRRHAQESTQARDHAVAATNPATNLSLDPPETLAWGITRTEHAYGDLLDSGQACRLATRADGCAGRLL